MNIDVCTAEGILVDRIPPPLFHDDRSSYTLVAPKGVHTLVVVHPEQTPQMFDRFLWKWVDLDYKRPPTWLSEEIQKVNFDNVQTS